MSLYVKLQSAKNEEIVKKAIIATEFLKDSRKKIMNSASQLIELITKEAKNL